MAPHMRLFVQDVGRLLTKKPGYFFVGHTSFLFRRVLVRIWKLSRAIQARSIYSGFSALG